MRSAFDFAPYRRSTVGFDRLFDMLENSNAGGVGENYPPFDLIKLGDNQYRIELAVAGFKSNEIDITAQQNVLIVTGGKSDDTQDQASELHLPGIANRCSSGVCARRPYPGQGRGLERLALDRADPGDPRSDEGEKINIGSGSEQVLHRRRQSAAGPRSRRSISEAQNA